MCSHGGTAHGHDHPELRPALELATKRVEDRGHTPASLLVVSSIDLEIYCDAPTVEPGFTLVSELARQPAIWKMRFSNELDRPDQGLSWQLRYRDDDAEAGSSICGSTRRSVVDGLVFVRWVEYAI